MPAGRGSRCPRLGRIICGRSGGWFRSTPHTRPGQPTARTDRHGSQRIRGPQVETRGAARPPDCVRGSRPGSGPHTALPAGHGLPSLSSSGSPQLHRELGGSPSRTPTTRRCQARHPGSTRPAPQMTRPPRDPQTGARSWVHPFASCLVTPHLASSGHRHPQGPCRYLRSFSRTGSPHVTRDGRPDRVSPQANRRRLPLHLERSPSRPAVTGPLLASRNRSSLPLAPSGPEDRSERLGYVGGSPAPRHAAQKTFP